MTNRRWALLLALIAVFTAVRVMTTHRVFSQTSDEPFHLAAGYEFLTQGTYELEPEHPPLARVIHALPFVTTAPPPPMEDAQECGNALLLRNDRYTQNLGRARLGNLLFLIVGIVTVALWGRRLVSPGAGLLAALLYASLPVILGHGGVATTDMAGAALWTLAVLMTTRFLEHPTLKNTILLGLTITAGALCKYSFFIFFPAAAIVLMLVYRRFPIAKLAAATGLAFLLVWAAFGFEIGTLAEVDSRATLRSEDVFGSAWSATIPLPAPRLVNGIMMVKHHDHVGHISFLFGEKSQRGWPHYFPVALFFKTPIPFLLLALAGCILLGRRRPEIPLLALIILAVGMTSHINIGIRHILPIYAPLSVAAAFAVASLPRLRPLTLALVAWMLISVGASHPDYIPWFNVAAGPHPEKILNDSNIDWGQDVLRLVRTTRARKIDTIIVSLFTTADLNRIGLPRHSILQAMSEVDGWLAISEMHIALGRAYSPEVRVWLDQLLNAKPYRRIGRSIRLYDLRKTRPGARSDGGG